MRIHQRHMTTWPVVPFGRKMSHPKRGYSPVVWYRCQTLTDSCQNFVLSQIKRSRINQCKQNKHEARVTEARVDKKINTKSRGPRG